MSVVQEALTEFNDESITYKLLKGVYDAVPYSPDFTLWATVDDAVRALKPTATDEEIARAQQVAASSPEVANIIWMARLLDAGDKGYAIVTGLASAWKLFQGKEISEALDTDNQQLHDAVLKALGIAYMVYHAYPGTLQEKAVAFRDSPTGQAMMMYYGAIEVALPFADNAVSGVGDAASGPVGRLSELLTRDGGAQAQRLADMAKGHDLEGAAQMLAQLTDQLQKVATHASGHVKTVADNISTYVPGAMSAADQAAGALANAADVMPVYRLLGGRLAAESAARRALAGPTA